MNLTTCRIASRLKSIVTCWKGPLARLGSVNLNTRGEAPCICMLTLRLRLQGWENETVWLICRPRQQRTGIRRREAKRGGLNGMWKTQLLHAFRAEYSDAGPPVRGVPRPGRLQISAHPVRHGRRQKRARRAQQTLKDTMFTRTAEADKADRTGRMG